MEQLASTDRMVQRHASTGRSVRGYGDDLIYRSTPSTCQVMVRHFVTVQWLHM